MPSATKVVAFLLSAVFTLFQITSSSAAQERSVWKDPHRLLLLGIERLSENDFREALPLFDMAGRLESASSLPAAWLGAAFHLARRLDEATVYYRRVLELEPVKA